MVGMMGACPKLKRVANWQTDSRMGLKMERKMDSRMDLKKAKKTVDSTEEKTEVHLVAGMVACCRMVENLNLVWMMAVY